MKRFPWAGLLAVVLILVIDALAFGEFAPWQWLADGTGPGQHMERGLAHDRLAMRALSEAPDDSVRIVVLGSSRAERGFNPSFLERGLPEHVRFLRFSHAGMTPFEMRAVSNELTREPPEVFMVLLSEFDTHHPLELRTILGAGNFTATTELIRLVSWEFLFQERDTFFGLTLASALNAYRYRALWDAAELSAWRHVGPANNDVGAMILNEVERMRTEGPGRRQKTDASTSDERAPKSEPRASNLPEWTPLPPIPGESFTETLLRNRIARRAQLRDFNQREQVRAATLGPHAEIQMQLVESMVREQLAVGAQVLLVEGPLNPLADELRDSATIEEFRAFARELEALPGVELLWLHESGPFPAEFFGDITHLNPAGAQQLCEHVRARLARMLSRVGLPQGH
ncbi:MAG: hypothetical protein DHS20C15_31210 [Planctomycetota bacterium]|nr:MAG: hypothetical protein DHS20C15_31210 [Planctomycetota bacterium]